jgi:copper homeostasis protein (lipoprotein)
MRGVSRASSVTSCLFLAAALVLARGVSAEPLAPLPATFVGLLPCADCPGIRYHLNLFPDHSYLLRTTYLERPSADRMDDIGVWVWSSDGGTLILRARTGSPQLLALQDGQTLRLLDGDARPLPSSVPSELRRTEAFQAFEPILNVVGRYLPEGAAGVFTECLTGQRWPIAADGDNAALASTYQKLKLKPDVPLVVQVHARLVSRPQGDGGGARPVLVVQRFANAWPGQGCGPRYTPLSLAGAMWTLTRLGGQTVRQGSRGAPALSFRSEPTQVAGWGGCSTLRGTYRLDGAAIAFADIQQSHVCPDPEAAASEAAFVAVLARAKRWRILGHILQFQDAEGNEVARLEGVSHPLPPRARRPG